MNNVIVNETSSQMWTIVLVGLVTVFLCLIFLVAMVSFFKKVFTPGSKKQSHKHGNTPVSVQKAVEKASGGTDNNLVAVIAAAISAASGAPVSSFRIASIEYSGFNTPAWGHVDRAGRQ